ncbi:hypothetical protein NL464_27310, partial [Klebsiella pneumoniae]|nr:hypothetical protein [Klebsiella pneumoniae]
NKVPFIQFLKSYDFPYIEGREQEFIQGLSSQITTHCVNLYTAEHKDTIQIQLAQSLLQLLMACSEQRINELGLTMDIRFEEPQDD